MNISFRLIALMSILGSTPALAQKCKLSISGYVMDQHDRQPLPFSEVYIRELGRGTVVDSTGFYHIDKLCPGTYQVTASHIGCEPVTLAVIVKENVSNLNFYPEHHTELLSEAEIISIRSRTTADAEVRISEREIEQARGQSLEGLMSNSSGVNTLSSGSTIIKPVIHGLYGNRVVTLNNGIRQEDQQWGLEHGLNADLFTADEVTITKGAGNVRYGTGAVGGVLRLQPAKLPFGHAKLHGKAYLIGHTNGRGFTTALRLERGLGKNWALRTQLTGEIMGDRSAPDYFLSNTGNRELDGTFTLGYQKEKWQGELYYSLFHTELGILRSAHIGNKTDFDLALARGEPFYQDPFSYAINSPRQDLTHQLLKSRLQYHPSAKGTLELVYSIQNNQRLEYDVRRGDAKNVAANNLNLSTQTLDLTARWNHSPKWNAEYGISGLLQINSNIPGTGIRPLLPNYNRYQGGAFMVQEYHTSRWIWEAGIRYDREYTLVQKFNFSNQLIRPEFSFNNLAASAGATYSFNRHWQLSNLLAYAYRPPHVNELMSEGLHHGAATIEVGDSSLVPERSLNWSTTLSANYPNAWKMELTAYLNPFQNYIYLNPQQEPRITIRGTFPVQQYTQDHVLLAGADLQGSIFLTTKLEYSLSGTYVRGINRSDDDDLVLMPPPQLNHSIHYYFRDFTLLKNSFISVSQKLVARQVHSPRDADLAPPPDAYSLLGLSMGTELPASDNRTFTFSLGVQNLLNTPYRDYLNRFRYYADQTGVNLQLKIKYEF